MKNLKILSLVLMGILFVNCNEAQKKAPKQNVKKTYALLEKPHEEASLFQRLGGEKGVASIVDMVLQKDMQNPELKHLFKRMKDDPQHYQDVRRHAIEFVTAGTGGGGSYTGKDLPSAHKGMQITERQLLLTIDTWMYALDQHNIDVESKKDVLFILYSLKDQVLMK